MGEGGQHGRGAMERGGVLPEGDGEGGQEGGGQWGIYDGMPGCTYFSRATPSHSASSVIIVVYTFVELVISQLKDAPCKFPDQNCDIQNTLAVSTTYRITCI